MIVPFIFNMATFSEAPLTWFFVKGIQMVKYYRGPIIGLETYINSSKKDFIKLNQGSAVCNPATAKKFGYEVPKKEDFHSYKGYALDQNIIDDVIEEKGSISDAFIYFLNEPHEPLVNNICQYIDKIVEEYNEPIEAFCVLCHIPSLSVAAEKYGIPVIHYEMGCFRDPAYIKTAFMDNDNLMGGNTIEVRYKQFLSEMKGNKMLLSNKEILALMLRPEFMYQLDRYGKPAKRKCGVALGSAIELIFQAQSAYNDSELLYRVSRKYGMENMLVRTHPGDPFRAQYPKYASCFSLAKQTPIDFILYCDEIFSLFSNLALEAKFWGKKVHVMLRCPSYYHAAHSVEESGLKADNTYLNFIAMNYLIPFEYMMNEEYIRYRLGNPSEREIFEKHISFYLKKKGFDMELLNESHAKRLEKLKIASLSE